MQEVKNYYAGRQGRQGKAVIRLSSNMIYYSYLRYTVLMNPKKEEAAVCCDPALSVLVMFGVSKRFSRRINFAVHCLSSHCLADQISCRSYIDSVYRMPSLAVSDFSR